MLTMKLTATKPPNVFFLFKKKTFKITYQSKTLSSDWYVTLIRHSDLEIAPSKSIPEKYNRHTQQIVNHATQLDKKLFKLKCPVQSINTSSNIKFNFFKICFTNSHRERKINMIVLQSRELHFSRITIHYFHSMNNTFTLSNLMSFICPTVSHFPQKARKIRIKITEKPAFLNVDAKRPLRFARQYLLKKIQRPKRRLQLVQNIKIRYNPNTAMWLDINILMRRSDWNEIHT